MTDACNEEPIRIMQPFRSRDAMVYDTRGCAGRLTLPKSVARTMAAVCAI